MSDFRLYPVPQSKLGCIEPLFKAAAKEMGLSKRVDPLYSLARLEEGYDNRSLAAYVDSLESPSHCLILSNYQGQVLKGTIAFVRLIYSLPEKRGDRGIIKTMMATIENYARLHGAISVSGSSWKLSGGLHIDALWKSFGYTEQEVIYTKQL